MNIVVQRAIEKAARPVFTRTEAEFWSGRDGPALNALLKRAVKAGDIIRYRRGLYGLAPRFARQRIHPFALAQYIHGPSYISVESALSHHGWIPEAVYSISSVTMTRSKKYETSAGLFLFNHIPQSILFAGVSSEKLPDGGSCFMARPLKAIADYVYMHRHTWHTVRPLVESLRIEEDQLSTLSADDFDELDHIYSRPNVLAFLRGLRKELSL